MNEPPPDIPVAILEQIDRLCVAFEERWKVGQRASLDDDLQGVPPEYTDVLLLYLVWTEIRCRREEGESPALEEYTSRFPQLEQALNAADRVDRDNLNEDCIVGLLQTLPQLEPVGGTVTLRIIAGPHQGELFIFRDHNTLMIGRAADAHWQLVKDPFFSRYHFRVEANPPTCVLVDLESTNGTFVNGQRTEETRLVDGDIISGGDTRIAVEIDDVFDRIPAEGAQHETKVGGLAAAAAPGFSIPSFAEYEILEELGCGAMGVVYYARHKGSGKELAIKTIHPQTVAGPDAVRLFLREASILVTLRHPRIVECTEVGVCDGTMYLAMEYLPAVNLRETLKKQTRQRAIRVACGIVCRVLEALQFAHVNDVVHRDVKPSNILVYRKPNQNRVSAKLADFGLAKNYLNAGFTAISEDNQVKGTLAFMAPEQLINCRYAKPSCDIYAAGACLYYFLTGTTPHNHDTGSKGIAEILNEPAIPISQRDSEIPVELAIVVDRALARDPANRFSSATHMANALEQFVNK